MRPISLMIVLITLGAAGVAALSAARADQPKGLLPAKKPLKDVDDPLGKAEMVFTAKLVKVTEGPVALSLPPIRSYLLEFADIKIKRGIMPAKAEGWYMVKSKHPPRFADRCTVGARMVGGRMQILHMSPFYVPADKEECPRLPPDPGKIGIDRRKLENILEELERIERERKVQEITRSAGPP